MKAVLYTNDMIPITVLELNVWCDEYLLKHRRLRLPVIEQPSYTIYSQDITPCNSVMKIVTIHAEILMRRGHEHMMLFTEDEDHALMLRCGFLPGQQIDIRDREKQAFALGFMNALERFRG